MDNCILFKTNKNISSHPPIEQGNYISYEIQDGIAVVTINDQSSKVNVLSEGLIKEAEAILSEVKGSSLQSTVKGIVFISGKTDCFVAGADINMLEKCKSVYEAENLAREGHRFLDEIEKSPIPIVAAIKGLCVDFVPRIQIKKLKIHFFRKLSWRRSRAGPSFSLSNCRQ